MNCLVGLIELNTFFFLPFALGQYINSISWQCFTNFSFLIKLGTWTVALNYIWWSYFIDTSTPGMPLRMAVPEHICWFSFPVCIFPYSTRMLDCWKAGGLPTSLYCRMVHPNDGHWTSVYHVDSSFYSSPIPASLITLSVYLVYAPCSLMICSSVSWPTTK